MNDNNYELELKCLAGKPIYLYPNLFIHKVSFGDMLDIGYAKYNNIIQMLCMKNEDLSSELEVEDVDVYKYIISMSVYAIENNEEEKIQFFYDLINVLSLIFKNDVIFNYENKNFIIGKDGILHRNNFMEFVKILKIRNCLDNIELEDDNPDSERTRQLLERRKQLREKVNKTKQISGEDGGLTLLDLISIYAEAEHTKLEDIFEYDMYQFNNQFNRMKIFMDYDINIRALLAGAKKEDINIQHWLSKINKD